MRSWSVPQRFAAFAVVFALIAGTTLVVVGWRLHHGWPVVEQSEQVASYRIDTVDERTLVLSDVFAQWRRGTWWPDWSSHHYSLRFVGDDGASLTVEDEHGGDIYLMRSSARRLPFLVDGVAFAAFPGDWLDLPGLPAPAVLVDSNSGGAPFCLTLHLVVLDPGRPAVHWRQEHGTQSAQLIDADGDGVAEILTGDDGFEEWRYQGAPGPTPTVILRWDGSAFVPATGRWLPTNVQVIPASLASHGGVETAEQAIVAWFGARKTGYSFVQTFPPPRKVTQRLLDLIYRGRGDLAHAWLQFFWPDLLDRREFIRRFSAQLLKCRFFPATDALTPPEHRWPR